MTDVEHLLGQLQQAGLRPTPQQWERLRAAGAMALPGLVDLALDGEMLLAPPPAAYGPVHALRLLGELAAPEPETIDRLLGGLPIPAEATASDALYVWQQDLPQILGRWGKATYERARLMLLDEAAGRDQRGIAAESLGYAAEVEPDLRPEVTALFQERLAAEHDPHVLACVIDTLGHLGASETYREVMAAFKRGAVDKEVVSAAEVRQRLLNPAASRRLACVHHSLTERYDQHGPYTEEQRRLMAEHARRSR